MASAVCLLRWLLRATTNVCIEHRTNRDCHMTIASIQKLTRGLGRALALSMLVALLQTAHAQSSVDSDINMVKGEAVKISNIDDWLIGVFAATDTIAGAAYNWDWECVYTSTGAYRVELTSANGGSQLRLLNGAGDQMRYYLYTYHRRGATYTLEYFTDTVININNLSGSTSLTCADEPVVGTNLWFAAVVFPADFNAAPPGIYTDFMTLVVSPE